MAAAHALLHWNNNLGYFSTLYLRLFLNQVVLIWIAHIRMTQLVVGTRVKYSVYGGKKRAEYYGQHYYFLCCHLHQISFFRCSFSSDRLHCILRWEEQVVTSRISPPCAGLVLGYTWLPECAAQCPARALPHAVLMMPVPSPAPAQPSNIPTISYISAALQPAACSLQPAACSHLLQTSYADIW